MVGVRGRRVVEVELACGEARWQRACEVQAGLSSMDLAHLARVFGAGGAAPGVGI